MFNVETFLPGFHWLPGVMPQDTLRHPDIANAFILEQNDDVYLVDSGVGTAFRAALRRYFTGRRYRTATLVNSHGHVDHVCNNDILDEMDARERRHLIHPAGTAYLNVPAATSRDARETARYFWPATLPHFPLRAVTPVAQALAWLAPGVVFGVATRIMLRKFAPIRNRTRYVSPLDPAGRKAFPFGHLTLAGWPAGDLLLLDDGAHSPDSVAVYDPERRILLVGDLTYPYDPLWVTGSYARSIANLRVYRTLTAEGRVAILGDGHSHRLFHGPDEILPFLDSLVAAHQRRRAAILRVATEHRLTDLEAIRRILVRQDPEFAQMAAAGEFPLAYRSTRAMIAVALAEEKAAGG